MVSNIAHQMDIPVGSQGGGNSGALFLDEVEIYITECSMSGGTLGTVL